MKKRAFYLGFILLLALASCNTNNSDKNNSTDDSGSQGSSEPSPQGDDTPGGGDSQGGESQDDEPGTDHSGSESHEHNYQVSNVVEPTTESEGSIEYICECLDSYTRKILKLTSISLNGSEVNWTEVENAEGYYFYQDNEEGIDVGSLTAYQPQDYVAEKYCVVAYTTDEEYELYETLKAELQLNESIINIQEGFNYDFENDASTYRLDATNSWCLYPYGNWSDRNNGNGGYYYVTDDGTGNMVAKVPAVVWWPGNTTLKKDLYVDTCKPGIYEISFDIKISERAATLVNGSNKHGFIKGYMWTDANNVSNGGVVRPTYNGTDFFDAGIEVSNFKTDEWTNVRIRYEIIATGTYNQFNLVYWPENAIGDDNYVMLDNIEVYQVVDNVAVEQNIDNLGCGDFEYWNAGANLPVDTWVANKTIDVESGANKSKLLKEDGNTGLFISGTSNKAYFNLAGNPTVLGRGGLFEMKLKVKKGSAMEENPHFTMAMWSWANGGSPFALVDEKVIDISTANADEYKEYSIKFASKGMQGCDAVNIYFSINLYNYTEQSDDKYIVIDDVRIYSLMPQNDDTINLLMIGNSYTDDTMTQIPYAYNSIDNLDKKLNIYGLIIGGSALDLHYQNFTENNKSYELRHFENGAWKTTTNVSIKEAISLEAKWDYVTLQQRSIDCANYASFGNLLNLMSGLRKSMGNSVEIVWNNTWSYPSTNTENIGEGKEFANSGEMYEAIIDMTKNNLVNDDNIYGLKRFIPNCTAIENLKTIYSEAEIYRDELHLTYDLGRLTASLTAIQVLFTDIDGVSYIPNNLTQTDLNYAIKAAKAAVSNPWEVTKIND